MPCVTTKPIKQEQFQNITKSLLDQGRHEYVAIALLVAKATRIGDILTTITIDDMYDPQGNIRPELTYNEGKTGKPRIIPMKGELLLSTLRTIYDTKLYCMDRSSNLFHSRKGRISNVHVNRILQQFVGQWGIEHVSTHSLRKTSARHLFESGVPLEVIQKLLNHSSPQISARYICVNDTDVAKALTYLEY